MSMKFKQLASASIVALTVYSAAPAATYAASVTFTPALQTAFDRTAAAADSSLAAKLKEQYAELAAMQEQERGWDAKLKAIHEGNAATTASVRKQLKQIDADKRSRLEQELKQTRERHQRTFDLYSSLNRQIEVSRALKTKEATAVLRAQADAMKPAVQLARADIRAKENALQTAKAATAKTVKAVRSTLAGIDPINAQIKAKKAAIPATGKSFATVWTSFSQALKKSDAKGASAALANLVSLSRQTGEQKEAIYKLEQKIGDIVAKAKEQMEK